MRRERRRPAELYETQTYYFDTDGSSARKLQPIYSPEEEVEESPQIRPERHVRPVRHPLDGLDFFIFAILLAATVFTMAVCFDYLKVQSGITTMEKKISQMEAQILETQKENKEMQEELEASVDLSYVYDVATKELGMVQPKKEQIRTYSNRKSDMIRQYTDIPEMADK